MTERITAAQFQEQYGHKTNPASQVSHAKPKRNKASTLGSSIQREMCSNERTRICFTGRRVRPLDPDNFAGGVKDLLDGLRHSGIISGDEPWKIILETDQEKVDHFYEEETIIEITIP